MPAILAALSSRRTTAALLALGIFLRLAYLLCILRQGLVSDAASYRQMADSLASGSHFIPYWPPALPLFLAAAQLLFGKSILVTRLAMIPLAFALGVVLIRLVTRITANRACANLALLLLTLSPGMICASVEPTTELPSALLLTLIAWLLLRIPPAEPGNRIGIVPGLTLGLALGSMALLRPASLVLLAVVPLFLLWRTRAIRTPLAALLVSSALVFSWIGYVQHTTGAFVVINTANSRNLFLGNNPRTPLYRTWWLGSHHETEAQLLPPASAALANNPRAMQQEYSRLAREYILAHPGLFLLRTFNRICVYFGPDTYAGAYLIESYHFPRLIGFAVIALDSGLFLLLAAASLLYLAGIPSASDPAALPAAILVSLVALYAFPYFLAFSHPRYHFPLEPLMMAAAAAFLQPALTGRKIVTPLLPPSRRWAVASAILALCLIQAEFVFLVFRPGIL